MHYNTIKSKKYSILLIVLIYICIFGLSNITHAAQGMKDNSQDIEGWLKELETGKPDMKVYTAKKIEKKTVVASELQKPLTAATEDKSSDEPDSAYKVTVDFYKVDLHNVFRLIGEISGKNIVVDEDVEGSITLSLREVPWPFMLDIIKNLKGLASIERDNTIMIFPREKDIGWSDVSNSGSGLQIKENEVTPEIVEKQPETVPLAEVEIFNKGQSKTPLKQRMDAEAFVRKAFSFLKRRNELMAYEYLKRAAKLWPDNYEINKHTAALALKQEDELAAYNYGRKAFYLNPSDKETAGLVAVALARMNKTNEAVGFFEKAMESDNISRDIIWNYAVFTFSNANYSQTLRLLDKIEKAYDLTPDVIMLKAQALEYLDRKQQALEEYRTILNAGGNLPKDMVQFAQARVVVLEQGAKK